MMFITKYEPHKIMAILQEQVDSIPTYSEDLNFASNKDMGPKGFFEMACNHYRSSIFKTCDMCINQAADNQQTVN